MAWKDGRCLADSIPGVPGAMGLFSVRLLTICMAIERTGGMGGIPSGRMQFG